MIKKHSLSLLLTIISLSSFSQDSLSHVSIDPKKNLANLLLNTKIDINARSFFMSTNNEGLLKDDYAFASGIGLGINTTSFHGFQFGLSSFVTYNLVSSNLAQPNSSTQGINRYEVGLFDIQNLNNKQNIIRIENLFLKYNYSKSNIAVGKMKLNTPFLNPQDGRMNSTLEEGIWLCINELKKIQINGGWVWNISPRSTSQWFTASHSIGIYPSGITETGSKSNYYGNINSSGVAIANIQFTPVKKIKLNVWDVLIDNVMNTSMIELNIQFGKTITYYQGIMYIHQNAINNGGNVDQTKTYTLKQTQSNVISAQFGVKTKKINANLNYTHITNDGRYLMPREWGKDPFYTFMPRERNEGFGNVHAISTRVTLTTLKDKLKLGLGYGYFKLPDVKDYKVNKYGMPSYHQINIETSYLCSKFFKGLDIKFITAYKIKQGETYNNQNYIYNKVNMFNFNFILDYKI